MSTPLREVAAVAAKVVRKPRVKKQAGGGAYSFSCILVSIFISPPLRFWRSVDLRRGAGIDA